MGHIEIFDKYKSWLLNPKQNYIETCGNAPLRYLLSISPTLNKYSNNYEKPDPVNVITQFYIDKNGERQKEIIKTLHLNVHNKSIHKIYLLNERTYTNQELGIESDKIIQIILNHRVSFKDIFQVIENINIKGYIVIANSDIFFDKTLDRLKQYDLKNRNVLTLCRYEYSNNKSLKQLKLFDNGRPDSQDVWIFHSDNNIKQEHRKIFDFMMGKPGCDNKLIYLFNILGYMCYNEPNIIKSYHYHIVQVRNYKSSETVPPPYSLLYPVLNDNDKPSDVISFNFLLENERLYKYINDKITNKNTFIIPRIAGIENQMAYYGVLVKNNKVFHPNAFDKIQQVMKNNAGIKISNMNSIIKYSQLYLESFHHSDIYFDWEPCGNVAKWIMDSLMFMHVNFNKNRIWSHTLDIFNYIQVRPWTHAFRGKRILIVSAFVDSIKEKLDTRDKIYGIDLFPECEFVFIKPPQTQGENPSREFYIELNEFTDKIKEISGQFDIALVSCGGYGNLVCSEIYKMGKSALYIGGVLQMYFGIYGSRWERERADILSLYKNEYWTRPKENERPQGFKNVEGSCYW